MAILAVDSITLGAAAVDGSAVLWLKRDHRGLKEWGLRGSLSAGDLPEERRQ